jgi:hypothetical protein
MHGSIGRVPASQVKSPEFKSHITKKKKVGMAILITEVDFRTRKNYQG